ncbi:50S ribosomal protein L9 [Qiania dongpingensis]|uniref:Large ribosomal subunit protein bL9 n=1 Tax=Qiania dongpingensis TaxID=2763669 RepID=A0A7G9G1G7_9FIRM|nr:50S ribosomal protein L9 [Qiania dongpingensis]QNM04649.1 50S ribosomal protein L9 [Qiania dongpingensis]
MEVVLMEDVKALGKKGQIVKVNDGYARNYILPKKLGVEATAKNLNDLKLKQAHDEKMAQEQLEAARSFAARLESCTVELAVKSGEGGKVFGSVSSKEIVAAAKEQLDMELDKKKIQIQEPIKTLGTHEILIRLHKDVTAKLKVHVTEK